jgi:hypothetical protein
MAMTWIGLALIAGGIALAIWGWRRHGRLKREAANALESWQPVDGMLSEARIERERQYGSEGGGDEVVTFTPVVRYSYTAGGRALEGARSHLTRTSFDTEAEANAWLAALKPGGPVRVWHDPAQVDRSALELDPPTSGSLLGTAFGVAMLVGLGIMVLVA